MLMDADRLNSKRPWTPREVADQAGFHVDTIYRHIKQQLLDAKRVGRQQWRIADDEARRYIDGHK